MKTLTLIILSLAFMGSSVKPETEQTSSEEINTMYIVMHDYNQCSTGDRFCNDCEPNYYFFISNVIEVTCYNTDFSVSSNVYAALNDVKVEFVRTLHYNYPKLTAGGDSPCGKVTPNRSAIIDKWYLKLEDAKEHIEIITAKVRESDTDYTIYNPHISFENHCNFKDRY